MKKNRLFVLAAFLALIAGGILTLSSSKNVAAVAKSQSYEFATIGSGTIESLVSSSGTLSVVSSVSVIAQMSGRIEKVEVDYNQRVKKGQVLATINTDLLRLQAKVAQAAVDKAQANYDLKLLAAQNAQTLFSKGLLAEYDFKTAQSTVKSYEAELSSAKASLEEIETEINQYAIITSPMDGIVLERDIDVGQSVVGGGSGTSTSLFTIAGNLSKMQIKAEVDELDISSIKVGQEVRFSVEANPGQTFSGSVKEIRLVPKTTDNVVNYYVIIDADNASGKLLPGMTASVDFIKQKKSGILVVPSAAFRFTPASLSAAEIQKELYLAGLGTLTAEGKAAASASYDADQKALAAASSATTKKTTGLTSLMSGGGMGGPPGAKTSSSASGATAQATVAKKALWYLDGSGQLAVTMVETGVSDGSKTELVGAADLDGKSVILKVKAE
jgi:HlyD family secretion protein